MSGHSKWSSIKHKKGAADAKRGKVFTKLIKEITVAARLGGGDPDGNPRLRTSIMIAKSKNMPVDNITRAIKKGTGELEGVLYEEHTYEGYGPGGVGIMLETLTDNKNRTVSDIRSTLTKAGGNMAESGAVAWQFEQKGVIIVEVAEESAENLALAAIDAGADDFETYAGTLHIYSNPSTLEGIRSSLNNNQARIASTELSMIPSNTIMLEKGRAIQTLRLLDSLEELDDVQKVYSNADFPEEALASFQPG